MAITDRFKIKCENGNEYTVIQKQGYKNSMHLQSTVTESVPVRKALFTTEGYQVNETETNKPEIVATGENC
jgi:hypothetical protein